MLLGLLLAFIIGGLIASILAKKIERLSTGLETYAVVAPMFLLLFIGLFLQDMVIPKSFAEKYPPLERQEFTIVPLVDNYWYLQEDRPNPMSGRKWTIWKRVSNEIVTGYPEIRTTDKNPSEIVCERTDGLIGLMLNPRGRGTHPDCKSGPKKTLYIPNR